MDLIVELYGMKVGELREDDTGFDFAVSPEGAERFGLGSRTLSLAVPLVENPRPADAPVRRNFFDEVLPEGRARTRLAGNARIAPDYTIGMLARYGRDVAGAMKVWDPSSPGEPREPSLLPVTGQRVAEILADVASTPIGNTTARRMSSLAGVQDKIVMVRTDDGQWAEPLNGYASTHIVKPIIGDKPTVIFDEEYGARIARHLGLAEYATTIERLGDRTGLVIERYDRSPDSPDGRVHQEDFNQALGFSGDGKYESEGHPGLKAIAQLMRRYCGRADVEQLLRLTTMSIAVGNYDMHAKNISVLHLPDGSHRIAPAYDIVPQAHHGFDPTFSFSVNGKMDFEQITLEDVIIEGASWGVRSAQKIAEDAVAAVQGFVREERPHVAAHPSLAADIDGICSRLLEGDGAGCPGSSQTGTGDQPAPLPESPGGWGGPVAR